MFISPKMSIAGLSGRPDNKVTALRSVKHLAKNSPRWMTPMAFNNFEAGKQHGTAAKKRAFAFDQNSITEQERFAMSKNNVQSIGSI